MSKGLPNLLKPLTLFGRCITLRGHTFSTETVEQLQADLDQWLNHYNTERTHQGKMCCGRTPFETMIKGKEIWKEKFVDQI